MCLKHFVTAIGFAKHYTYVKIENFIVSVQDINVIFLFSSSSNPYNFNTQYVNVLKPTFRQSQCNAHNKKRNIFPSSRSKLSYTVKNSSG